MAEARTSHGTGFARILAEFSSRYELETSEIDMVYSAHVAQTRGTMGEAAAAPSKRESGR